MSKADEGEIVEEEESGEEDDMGKYMFGSDDEDGDKPEEKKPEDKTEEQKPVQSLREVGSNFSMHSIHKNPLIVLYLGT